MKSQEIRNIPNSLCNKYNQLVSHPLQSWQWGEFRKKTGVEVVRKGIFSGEELVGGFQLTIHKIPYTPWTIGYFPKGDLPTKDIIKELSRIGHKRNCIFVKLEPNVKSLKQDKLNKITNAPDIKFQKSPHPLFTKYTFQLDLTKKEDELLKQMKPKTRYNIRLARRKGVEVIEDNSKEAFEKYIKLMEETTKRQKFYAHNENYHRKMWETLYPAEIAHLLKAVYKKETLAAWIIFLFNNNIYYPYGWSSSKHRNVMASNLIMWEAILWGKKKGAKVFDMWGCLGKNPDKSDPWYGFHRFKEGYSGKLVEFVGSYDLVLKPEIYKLYNLAYALRWKLLH